MRTERTPAPPVYAGDQITVEWLAQRALSMEEIIRANREELKEILGADAETPIGRILLSQAEARALEWRAFAEEIRRPSKASA